MTDTDFRPLAPARPGSRPDVARTDGLDEAVAKLLPALEQFNRFEGRDRAPIRSEWGPLLDEPLPQQGVGMEAVL